MTRHRRYGRRDAGLRRSTSPAMVAEPPGRGRSDTWFLLAWLGLEVAGYVVLTPFPAASVRDARHIRSMLTIMFRPARNARLHVTASRQRLVNGIIAMRNGPRRGLPSQSTGWEHGPTSAARRTPRRSCGPTAAAACGTPGSRAFRYYAERCGMVSAVPQYDPRPSYIRVAADVAAAARRLAGGDGRERRYVPVRPRRGAAGGGGPRRALTTRCHCGRCRASTAGGRHWSTTRGRG